jgi:hypothetical protein
MGLQIMRLSILQKTMDWFSKLSVTRKIPLIALIVLLIFFTPLVYRSLSWVYNNKICAMSGGALTRGGIGGKLLCVHPYSDGGKPCDSSTECIGGCVLYDRPISGQPTPSFGVCRYNDNPFVCEAGIADPDFFVCP